MRFEDGDEQDVPDGTGEMRVKGGERAKRRRSGTVTRPSEIRREPSPVASKGDATPAQEYPKAPLPNDWDAAPFGDGMTFEDFEECAQLADVFLRQNKVASLVTVTLRCPNLAERICLHPLPESTVWS